MSFFLSYSLPPQFCVFFSPCHVFNLFAQHHHWLDTHWWALAFLRSFAHSSPLRATFPGRICSFAYFNLSVSLFSLYTSSCVYFSLSQFVSFFICSGRSLQLFSLYSLIYFCIYLCLCLFLLSFPSRFISSALPVRTKLYAAVCWLLTPSHSLPLKMHYCVTELNWYCPGLFVHNIVLEFEF